MSRTNRNGIAKGIRWAARVIGLVITAFSFIMVAGDAIAIMLIQDGGFKLDTGDFLFVIMPVIIAVGGFITSWWRERIGGLLLILAYVLISLNLSLYWACVGLSPLYYWVFAWYIGKGWWSSPIFWAPALPFLISGVLFLTSSRLSRKTGSSVSAPTAVS
ncbi:MAG: hypothetical protein FJ005_02330 [Chloroflexi bacterium]|nr:hypothetical protein [Chloroflexota bacterium]